MKLFISWSGDISRQIAAQFREWLPMINQHIVAYMSEEDVEKGSHWSSQVRRELETTSYGLVILTPENTKSIWLHFEAGAIAKSVAEGRLSPVLFGLKQSDVHQPLSLFQTTIFDESDMLRLTRSINSATGDQARSDRDIEKMLKSLWPQLRDMILPHVGSFDKRAKSEKPSPSETESILQEMLVLVRHQSRILTNPEELFGQQLLSVLLRLVRNEEGSADRLTESERATALAVCARWVSIEQGVLQGLTERPAITQRVKWFGGYLRELQQKIMAVSSEPPTRTQPT